MTEEEKKREFVVLSQKLVEAINARNEALAQLEAIGNYLDTFGVGWREVFNGDYIGAIRQLVIDTENKNGN